jgi:hypothetical protein
MFIKNLSAGDTFEEAVAYAAESELADSRLARRCNQGDLGQLMLTLRRTSPKLCKDRQERSAEMLLGDQL